MSQKRREIKLDLIGKVQREDGLPLQRIQVRASHETERGSIRLGEDTTSATRLHC